MTPPDLKESGGWPPLVVVESISASEFSRRRIALGSAHPKAAFEEYGVRLYSVEPYQPQKVPLVFVHGLNDSPRCFAKLVSTLDSARWQCWYLFYPSGLSLSTTAQHLRASLHALCRNYGFSKLGIVAHSMGGLIARSALSCLKKEGGCEVSWLVTLSTPWAGHGAARTGAWIRYPMMRDSWSEIAAGGDFVDDIFSEPLPPETSYALLFSHKRRRRMPFVISGLPVAGNHDGFVSLDSQLHPAAQREAVRMLGFAEDHHGILRSSAAADAVRAFLEEPQHGESG